MFEVGNYVVKSGDGVCRVEKIGCLDISYANKDRQYYTLVAANNPAGNIYVPVDKVDNNIRLAMTKEQATEFISTIPEIKALQVDLEKNRELRYKEAIKSCTPEQLMALIKTIYGRKKKRIQAGKKATAMDEHYYKMAEMLLCMELAHSMQEDVSEVNRKMVEGLEG